MTIIDPKSDARTAKRSPLKRIDSEPAGAQVRIVFNGEVIAESKRALLYHETGVGSVYYLPREDVRERFLTPTDHTSYCPYKGDARYWTVTVGDNSAENAVWSYPDIYPDYSPEIEGWVSFYTSKVNQYVFNREPFTAAVRVAAE